MIIKLWSQTSQVDFIKMKRFNYALSIICSVISILLLCTKGLNFGIDFVGGINFDVRTATDISLVRHQLNQLNLGEVLVQRTDNTQDLSIKIGTKKQEENFAKIVDLVKQTLNKNGQVEYRKIDFVGPQVGKYLLYSGAKALALSFLAIASYIWLRFEWQFGIGVLVALIHDTILTLGFASLMQLDFSLSSIAALLTVIGYSVNDSVVIYDRIRTNLRQYKQKSITEIINLSVNQTLSRTTLTVASTLLANLALILFGGGEIRSFSILVFFGIIAGTYSSIFISAPVLTMLKLDKFK